MDVIDQPIPPVEFDAVADAISQPLSISDVIAPHIGVFFVAWAVAIIATPLMRLLAIRSGIVDLPDTNRKRHAEPVAYLGGLAIFAAWLAGVYTYLLSPALPAQLQIEQFSFPLSLMIGALVITVIGLIDDVYGISPLVKLGGQLFAAAMVANTDLGQRLVQQTFVAINIDAHPQVNYWLGMLVIAVFIIGACNAVNLLDGLDGLASGVTAIATIGFLVISCFIWLHLTDPVAPKEADVYWNTVRIVMCMAILGAVLGFLPHNFNPANIFMGDAGSLLLGYLAATTMLLFAHSPKMGPLLVSGALIVFALPIGDTALAIFRRIMARQPIFSGDRHHLHHQLVSAFRNLGCGPNLSVKFAVMTMYTLAAVCAALGCGLVMTRWRFVLAALVVFFGFVLVAGYKSGHRQAIRVKETDEQTGPDTSQLPASPAQTDPGQTAPPLASFAEPATPQSQPPNAKEG